MNFKIKTLVCFLLGLSATTATADNTYNWTGAYAGANLGVIWSDSDLTANHQNFLSNTGTVDKSLNSADVNPGLQFGYLHQLDTHWVLGAEADLTYPAIKDEDVQSIGTSFDKFRMRYDLQGALRIRVGYALDRILPYITSGISFGSMSLAYTNEAQQSYSKNTTQTGWVLGAGVEYGFLDNLSTRLEYLYTDYEAALNMSVPDVVGLVDPSGAAHVNVSTNVLRVAINYRF